MALKARQVLLKGRMLIRTQWKPRNLNAAYVAQISALQMGKHCFVLFCFKHRKDLSRVHVLQYKECP